MTYYIIVALPFLFLFARLSLTNVIIPYFKKKALCEQLSERADWAEIRNTDNALKLLFKGSHAKMTSVIYRTLKRIKDKAFIYGEIDVLSFYTILEKAKPKPNEIFYDLGSGAGKAVFTAAVFFKLSKSCGIELLPPLHQKATNQVKRATRYYQSNPSDVEKRVFKAVSKITLIHDNYLNYDFYDANIIYVAATCLSDEVWEQLICKMVDLKQGSRVIVASKCIQHAAFELIYQGIDLMSWGLCPVKIYEIK